MPDTCVVVGCTNRRKKGVDRSFHRFPFADADRLRKWVSAVSREDANGKPWIPAKTSQICSDHFLVSDFELDTKKRLLRNTAVPSVFPSYPIHKNPAFKPPRKSPKKRPRQPDDNEQPQPECIITNPAQRIRLEHAYGEPPVEPTLKLQKTQESLSKTKEKLKEKDKTIKSLKQKLKRRDVKLCNLLTDMESSRILSTEQHDLLNFNFDKDTQVLIENELKATKTSMFGRRYSEDVKSFAVTLHYYSAQAYGYVRKFLALPHPSTIRQWASSRNCTPGFLTEVLETLKRDLSEERREVVIMFDAIHLKKCYSYDSGTQAYFGSINCGHIKVGAEDTLASEALVFMIVGLKKHFKQPIGYFLIEKISASTQAQLVRDALTLVSEAGHKVLGVVCDGNFTNQATAIALGCQLSDLDNIKSHFEHPVSKENVYFIFDACHLMKNVRNCLGDLKVLFSADKTVRWQYLEELNSLQQRDNLVLANKLRGKHIHYEKNKMNVQIASQTLSASVASAIDFLRDDLCLPQFKGSEATTEFIKIFDCMFDLCNSSSPFAKGFKSPLNKWNLHMKLRSAEKAKSFILELSDAGGKKLVQGRRKTGFVGFICTLTSTMKIAQELLTDHGYNYVMTYRLSQDHLETFFSRIRRHHSWNNNPTPLQFKWALRALLLKNGVMPSKRSNCIVIEEPDNNLFRNDDDCPTTSSNAVLKPFIEALKSPSEYHQHALHYISGYIARTVASRVIILEPATFSAARQMSNVEG